MLSQFKNFFRDSDKSIQEKTYDLILLYVAAAALIAGMIFIYRGGNHPLICVLLCTFFLTLVLFVLRNKFKNTTLFSVILVLLLNLVVLPFLFLFGGGLISGMQMVFVGGYILGFILLSGKCLILVSLAVMCWDIIIFTYTFYYPEYIDHHFYGVNLVVDIIICLLTAVLVASMVWLVYEGVYSKVSNNLISASKKIENAGIVKSRFLANMSHELRTPMNAILGMSELLEKDDTKSGIAFEAGLIRESAYSLLTTINNVLTYSKLDSGRDHLALNQFKFSQLISDVIYSVNIEVGKKEQVVLFVNVDPNIPNLLYGDDLKIRNIFSYLLFAAVRQADEGRISLDIKHTMNPTNNEVTLYAKITDTGYGFSSDEKESIFSSYETYDTRKDSQLRRFGLELTICRYLIEMMGGTIGFDSIDGVGNEVVFTIKLFSVERAPIVDVNAVSNKKLLIFATKQSRVSAWTKQFDQFSLVPDFATSFVGLEVSLKDKVYDEILLSDYNYDQVKSLLSAYNVEDKTYIITDVYHSYGDFGKCRIIRRPVYSITLNTILNGTWSEKDYSGTETRESFTAPDAKILVVDDNIVNVKVAQSILSQYDIKTFISTSGRDAIEKIQYSHFDMVLLDQMMPEMDGIETLKQIRNLADINIRRIPVVCLTANIGEDIKEELLRAGFQDYLAKPIKIRYLEDILKAYLPENMIIHKKAEADHLPVNAEENSVQNPGSENAKKAIPAAPSNAQTLDSDAFPPGLTVERGLLQMGGDQSTYNLILNTYYKDCGEKLISVPQMFEEGDIKLYSITVHAIKGSSASVGALEVSELFRQLEMASKGGDIEFCRQNMPHAMDKLKEILQTVKDYLIEQNEFKDPNEQAGFSGEEPLDKDKDKDNNSEVKGTDGTEQGAATDFDIKILQKLVSEIDRINFDESDRIIDELTGSDFGEEINEQISRIKFAYDDFDYATVKDIVKEMQSSEPV